ncbi:hybrid sensor histidine kinase/response regulator [Desulfovibrio gilichinskyi]|uniref:histidine kinase n=1 Tax=Desulfovibrio gilichinskyi TaxID=1519643 RepID=A0A1X7C0V8_9BACT|nr:response regulator [Desulfovibrio gilichinskyi]SME87768.1 CheA signal transduction histidine kinase [Desulfovibrio gilichinskyi]
MPQINGDLRERLLGAFRGECRERLQVLSSDFMALEKGAESNDLALLVESSYREVHSLKGAARAVGLGAVEIFCQTLESFFSVLKKNSLVPSKDVVGQMIGWLDILENLIHKEDSSEASLSSAPVVVAIAKMKEFTVSPDLISISVDSQISDFATDAPASEDGTDETKVKSGSCVSDSSDPNHSVKDEGRFAEGSTESHAATARMSMSETVRISSSFLTGLLLQTEELLFSRNSQKMRSQEAAFLNSEFLDFSKNINVIIAEAKSCADESKADFYVKMEQKLESFSKRLSLLVSATHKAQWELASKVDTLLSEFKNSMLLPFSSLLEDYPRIVRNLSAETGRQCEFCVSGENVRIDRRILDMLHDPLMHMVRNSLAHGIESPRDRLAIGKTAVGKISFDITQSDRDIVKVVIGDDGQGINSEKIIEFALKQSIISKEEASELDPQSVSELIFLSGMSTSAIITDLSGRGLGMAIVRDTVESLGGSITISSVCGQGTTFVLNIPVALTSFRGIVVESCGQKFVVPKSGVKKVLLVRQEDIQSVNSRETIFYLDRPIPIINLSDVLELDSGKSEKKTFPVFIMGEGSNTVAVSMDELHGEHDVMAKAMGPLLKRVRNVSGFSMLDSGKLVPILHAPDMIRTAFGVSSGVKAQSFSHQKGEKEVKTVLVAEDSITSRTLLKNVLEAAGYRVVTAVNGIDALNKIKADLPDILVSDVEMPHMDGFILTAEVRKMPGSVNLPIVLVTSLGSAEHREKGVEAGADAYIVKSSFDQGNLLEVIQRLA